MTTTAGPEHVAAHRRRLEQAGTRREELQAKGAEAVRALEQALNSGSSSDIMKAQAAASAANAALASIHDLEATISAELAAAEAKERREAGRQRMVEAANQAVVAFGEFQKRRAKLDRTLRTDLPELGRIWTEIHRCRQAILQESRAQGADLTRFEREVETPAKDLLADIEVRGADLSVVRAVGGLPSSRLDHGTLPLEPAEWAWLIEQGLDGFFRGEAYHAHLEELAKREAELAARHASATQEAV